MKKERDKMIEYIAVIKDIRTGEIRKSITTADSSCEAFFNLEDALKLDEVVTSLEEVIG